jgi:hypothetical protein
MIAEESEEEKKKNEEIQIMLETLAVKMKYLEA